MTVAQRGLADISTVSVVTFAFARCRRIIDRYGHFTNTIVTTGVARARSIFARFANIAEKARAPLLPFVCSGRILEVEPAMSVFARVVCAGRHFAVFS